MHEENIDQKIGTEVPEDELSEGLSGCPDPPDTDNYFSASKKFIWIMIDELQFIL